MIETPIASAKQLLNQYGIDDPTDVPIEDLIWAQGSIYEEKSITGAEGRIVFAGSNSAIIVVKQEIKSPERKRFIRAHELGHLQLHRSLRPFFHCDVDAFLERNKQGSHESEANAFAAELLMPEHLFVPLVAGQPFSVELLQQTARRFQTSLMATTFRYMELGPEPIGFFFSKDGQLSWAKRSDGFIATYLQCQRTLPVGSVTHRSVISGIAISNPEMVTADVWFNTRRIPNDLLFYEQCVLIPSIGGAMIYVWNSGQFR